MSGASGIEHDPAAALNKPPREHSRWLAMRARAARVPLAVAGAAPLIGGVLLVIQAWLLARVLDQAIVQGAARAELATSIVAISALMLARAALAWLGERAGAAAAERIKRQVREALFARLLALGPQWSRQRASGELASAMVEQVEALDAFFAKYLPAMGAAAVLPVAFAVVVLPVDVITGLLLLVSAPLIPLFMALVGWGAEAASRRHLQAFARLSGFFADRLRGLATLKLYGRAEAEEQSVVAASDALRQRTMAVLRIAFLSSAVLEFFAAQGVAGVAVYIGLTYLGFLDVRASVLTLQGGFFCLLLAPEVYGPLRQFAAHYHDRAAARAAVAQIARTFDGLPSPGVGGFRRNEPREDIAMKQSTFTQARMAFDTTAPLEEVCRKMGMFEAAFYAWLHEGNRIAVRYAYEWHDDAGNWFRSYGNENWEFEANALMHRRSACINDMPIQESERKFHWPLGRGPDGHPGLSDLGLQGKTSGCSAVSSPRRPRSPAAHMAHDSPTQPKWAVRFRITLGLTSQSDKMDVSRNWSG